LRGRTSNVSMPLDNDGALNDFSSSRTERSSAWTSIPEPYPQYAPALSYGGVLCFSDAWLRRLTTARVS
jgi:hypothetical protein